MKHALFLPILVLLSVHYISAISFDPKAVDVLLREIRARLQAKEEKNNHPRDTIENEEIRKEELLDVDAEGSGSGEEIEEGSGITGVPLLDVETTTVKEKFPTPEPIFDKYGNLKSKDEIETLTFNNFKKQAPTTLREHYELNPTGTLQMLQGLDIHGASGGYHRALSGGYLPPTTYDPYNVNWHSYGERGIQQKDKAIAVFKRVIQQGGN